MKKSTEPDWGILRGVGLVVAVAAVTAYGTVIRPWHVRWGATDAEVAATLPGDELVPYPRMTSTHAITIHAPVSAVWPWLVQIGQDKAGFYSYTWLENLVGCQMPKADRIQPEFQHLQVGDWMRLHPHAPPIPVVRVQPERAMVLGSNTGEPSTWAFTLTPIDDNTTRLIIRGRTDWKPNPRMWFTMIALFEPAHFLMERKMMKNLKRLAENGG